MITRKKNYNTADVSILRKHFIANMSHEMRTPLNAIVGFSEELLKYKLSTIERQYVTNIKKSSESLIHVVKNLIMFSLENHEDIFKDESSFSLSKLVTELTSIFEQKAKAKDIKFRIHFENLSQNNLLFGDPQLLRQILYNLFDNCIKFTRNGNINAYFSIIYESGRAFLKIVISDTGLGIPNEEFSHIFNEFTNMDSSLTRKFGGIGLGLAICKKLIEELNGNISVSSAQDQVTIFELKIPYKQVSIERTNPISAVHHEEKMFSGKKFLVVDDDEYNRILAKIRLEDWGASVDLCNDGSEAIAKLHQQKYYMILLDIQMPVISGIDVAKFVRRQKNNINNFTPILAITASIKNEEQNNIYHDAGINDCLLKPYKENELFDKIILISNTPIMQPIATILPMKDYSLEELKLITKGDDEFLLLMLKTFLNTNKENVDALKRHVSKKEYKKISEIAHKMLNSFRQLKIEAILGDLEELELLIDQITIDSGAVLKRIEKINKYSKKIFIALDNEIRKLSKKDV